MKQLVMAVIFFAILGVVLAMPDNKPTVSDALKVQFLTAQKQLLQDQVQANQLNQQFTKVQEDYQTQSTKLAELTKQAYKDAGVTESEYTFDPTTLVFTAIPKTAPKTEDPAAKSTK